MTTERFEERLMLELTTRVRERAREQGVGAALGTPAVTDIGGESAAVGVEALTARHGGRRRLRLGTIAAATGLTAAIATVAITSAGGTLAGGAPQHPLFHMANAAYAIQQEPTGLVKLTILDANGTPNVDELRSDLAKAGIKARVLADVPDCRRPQPHPSPVSTLLPPADAAPPRFDTEDGKLVFSIDPRSVIPGQTIFVMYGQTLRHVAIALNASGDVPACIFTAADH